MMPDNETTPSLPSPAPAPRKSGRRWPALVLALLALAASGWQWYDNRQHWNDFQQNEARLLEAQRQTGEAQIKAVQDRLATLETRQEEFRSDADAVHDLRQDIARGREEATLLEVEQAVTLAVQQLQIAGNVQVARLALQSADARLARLDRPAYLPLRKALAKDIERLSALPFVDIPGIGVRLEQVVAAADKLPLAAWSRPTPKTSKPLAEATPTAWERVLGNVWQEIKGLVRIQRFEQESVVLLAPGQEFFLRENLKLRLLNARLALQARDQATFRADLRQAQDWLDKYFVADDKAVQTAKLTLSQAAPVNLVFEMPTLNDSQAALRSLQGSKEKP